MEPIQPIGISGDLARQQLESNLSPERDIPRAIYLAHSACAEQGADLVAADSSSDPGCREIHFPGCHPEGGLFKERWTFVRD
jgi:hypothetical protein